MAIHAPGLPGLPRRFAPRNDEEETGNDEEETGNDEEVRNDGAGAFKIMDINTNMGT